MTTRFPTPLLSLLVGDRVTWGMPGGESSGEGTVTGTTGATITVEQADGRTVRLDGTAIITRVGGDPVADTKEALRRTNMALGQVAEASRALPALTVQDTAELLGSARVALAQLDTMLEELGRRSEQDLSDVTGAIHEAQAALLQARRSVR